MRLSQKVAIITGAAGGIGRAAAVLFAREGGRVVVADRSPAGEDVAAAIRQAGGDAVFVPVDVAVAEQVRELVRSTVDRFGKLHVLVNNAAICINALSLVDTTEADWDATLATNLRGAFLCCKYGIPAILASGGGTVINVASAAGTRGMGVSTAYGVSKAGVIQLTRAGAIQFGARGVRVNCIIPGLVDTQMSRDSAAGADDFAAKVKMIPLGRVGQPDDIAHLMLFLAGDESGYLNGACIAADGGTSVR